MAQQPNARRPTHLNRRKFLIAASTSAVTVSFPHLILANSSANVTTEKTLSFVNLHTNETLQCCYWKNNLPILDELAKVNYILRDHRTQEVAQIDLRLIDMLHNLHSLTESTAPFEIISGYRSAKTNESLRKSTSGVAKRSLHMQGKAVDVRLPDIELKKLRDVAISLQAGGVGYYSKSGFLHLDTGRPRNW
ncbi:MAG: YcbK family protein [Gammaproteobacteria bacterium]